MARLNGLWRHHDFLLFWLSQTLSLFSIQVGNLAFPLVAIVTLDASATQVGLLAGTGSIPWLLFGLFAGVAIDRLRRRPILVAAHLGRALLAGSVPVAALLDMLTMEHLYLAAFGSGTLGLCFETAYHSYLPSLVGRGQLAEGNSKLAVTSGLTRVVGPGLAGAIVQWLTPLFGLGVNALSYLASGLLMWRIRQAEPPTSRREQASVWVAFRDGLMFAWRQTLVRVFTFSEATFMFFFSLLQAVLLVFFTRTLGLPPGLIGIVFAAGSVGGLLGALVARRFGERFAPGPIIIAGSLLRASGLAIIPLAAILGPFAVPALITSRLINAFGWTLWQVHQETTQQLVTPDELRGRVTGSSLFLVRGCGSLGGFAAAALATSLGVVPIVVIGALGALLSTAWLFLSPILHLRSQPDQPEDPASAIDLRG